MSKRNYNLTLTQQQYSDLMVTLAKVEGDMSFFPMLNLFTQLNHLIEADVELDKRVAEEKNKQQDNIEEIKPKAKKKMK